MSKCPTRQSISPERFSQLQFQPSRQRKSQTEDDNYNDTDNDNEHTVNTAAIIPLKYLSTAPLVMDMYE